MLVYVLQQDFGRFSSNVDVCERQYGWAVSFNVFSFAHELFEQELRGGRLLQSLGYAPIL